VLNVLGRAQKHLRDTGGGNTTPIISKITIQQVPISPPDGYLTAFTGHSRMPGSSGGVHQKVKAHQAPPSELHVTGPSGPSCLLEFPVMGNFWWLPYLTLASPLTLISQLHWLFDYLSILPTSSFSPNRKDIK
jgi:hypothetical protein